MTSNLNVLDSFDANYVNNQMLGINAEYVEGAGYTYDFDGNGAFNDTDRRYLIGWVKGMKGDNATGERVWPLEAIDHSTPVVAGPPGLPVWYYGSSITAEEREAYNTWVRNRERTRRTVAYVGSRSGMLHAFDAGAFRHGDDPITTFLENRGYFTGYSMTTITPIGIMEPARSCGRLSRTIASRG